MENNLERAKSSIRNNKKLIIIYNNFILRDGSYFKGHYLDNKKNGEGIF
jgi:hypothetical protein